MNCPECATDLPDDARFCGACGHRFDSSAEADASAAPAAEKKQSFDLLPEDFARALAKACTKAGVEPPPGSAPTDHATLFEAAEAAGITKLDVEKALHHVSIEKLPASARKAMGVVLEDEVEPQGRPLWLPVVVGINVVALIVALVAYLLYDPTPDRPPVEMKAQRGEIDMAKLSDSLDALAASAEACYKAALEKNPKLAGDVTVTLRVGLDGAAAEVSLSRDELGDPGVAGCITAAATAQAYPQASLAPVEVDVPLMFAATEK